MLEPCFYPRTPPRIGHPRNAVARKNNKHFAKACRSKTECNYFKYASVSAFAGMQADMCIIPMAPNKKICLLGQLTVGTGQLTASAKLRVFMTIPLVFMLDWEVGSALAIAAYAKKPGINTPHGAWLTLASDGGGFVLMRLATLMSRP